MAVEATNPITINTTFNLVAFPTILIMWSKNLNGPVIARYTMTKYATDSNGVNTVVPIPSSVSNIADLYQLAADRATAGKPALATALTAVITALTEIEGEKGTI
jgi:hypothetical protein